MSFFNTFSSWATELTNEATTALSTILSPSTAPVSRSESLSTKSVAKDLRPTEKTVLPTVSSETVIQNCSASSSTAQASESASSSNSKSSVETSPPEKPNDFNNCTNAPNSACGAQWLLLWTTAAYSPENPSTEDRESLKRFYTDFIDICEDQSFRKSLDHFGPPSCESRRDLMMWLCLAQNKFRNFNVRCRYKTLMERWRHVDGYL